jgi:multiple sugar transport system substrate-binding protein
VALFLAACGGRGAEPTVAAEPVELQLFTFDALGAVEQALIEQFEAAHPNIQVNLEPYRQQPENYLSDPAPPDLMAMVPGNPLHAAIDAGQLTDITDLWQQADLANAYPAALRNLSERDGKQYLLPIGYAWSAIYYNKQIFEQYDLQPPRTWDEFITLCDTLLLNGETPLALSGRDPFMASLWIDYLDLRLNGVDFHRQLSSGEISYEDNRTRLLFETWHSLVGRGYFVEDAFSLTDLGALTAIARNSRLDHNGGQAVMTLASPVFLADLPELFRAELDFFPFPTIDPTLSSGEVVFAVGYIVPAAAPHRSEALTFLNYLTSEEARALLLKDVNTTNLYAPAFMPAGDDSLPPMVRQGVALVQGAEAISGPYILDVSPSLQAAMSTVLRQLLVDPRSGKTFDVEGLVSQLETIRLSQE